MPESPRPTAPAKLLARTQVVLARDGDPAALWAARFGGGAEVPSDGALAMEAAFRRVGLVRRRGGVW
jgi:hypothetical protein